MKTIPFLLLLASTVTLVAGCSPDRGPADLIEADTEDAVVLDAILTVDAAFPTILLTRTLSPLAEFTVDAIAERNAGILIRREDGDIVTYVEAPFSPGEYIPASLPTRMVLPGVRYDITVNTQDGRTVTGSTRTPQRFNIDRWLLLEDDAMTERLQFRTFDELGDSVYTHPDNQVPYNGGLLSTLR